MQYTESALLRRVRKLLENNESLQLPDNPILRALVVARQDFPCDPGAHWYLTRAAGGTSVALWFSQHSPNKEEQLALVDKAIELAEGRENT